MKVLSLNGSITLLSPSALYGRRLLKIARLQLCMTFEKAFERSVCSSRDRGSTNVAGIREMNTSHKIVFKDNLRSENVNTLNLSSL